MNSLAPFILCLVLSGTVMPHEAQKIQEALQAQKIEKDWYKLHAQIQNIIGRTINAQPLRDNPF